MGNCLGSQDNRSGYSSYYHSDLELFERLQIYKPLPTSLFNTLRKPAECVIITGSASTIAEDVDLLRIDFANATPSSLKTLLNFKKIVYIGNKEGVDESYIKKVKEHVSFTKFYVVSEVIFKQFLHDYPIFTKNNWTQHEMVTNKLPLMLVDSKEFVHSTETRIRLFIHASAKQDPKIYALLGIKESMIIKEPLEGSAAERIKAYYVENLTQTKQNTIVMLHRQTMNASDILEVVAIALHEKYKIPINFSQLYLKRNWPNSTAGRNPPASISADEPITKTASIIVTGAQKFKKLFQKLEGESSEEKTQRAYNLLSTLLINIYSNPNEDSYREVKRTNRQLNDLLIKHKNGLKILDEVGFRQKDEHWVNTVESKYLKIYKTDLDLGFKRYKAKEQEQ